MITVNTIDQLKRYRMRAPSATWGFVPTMGALHKGHLSLVARSSKENDKTAVSIFVNPTQFNNPEDLKKYPRTLKRDLDILRKAGVDLVFAPDAGEVYPEGFQSYIDVTEVTKSLEGAARPGHLRGMATVVTKLFNIVEPTRAYFGQKDAQQVVVVKQFVRDLNIPVTIVVCPTVREKDGLAMSSRNVRLNPRERRAAAVLFQSLSETEKAWKAGIRDAEKLRNNIISVLNSEPLARMEYVSVADPVSLLELNGKIKQALVSIAVFIGDVRLIDNIVLK
ncbi:MAG TPA: pantoate--beta-alanine ligase [Patescibacteria group bacterium]|jgi:pantoate--beta-alanine ligase|nr:pantoate--beta-alanine ligase [Patescibacteria group bacterium]